MVVARILAVLAGVALVVTVLGSALKTVVVPRAIVSRLTRRHFRTFRRVFDLLASPRRPWSTRDRIMALYAPVALVALPGTWVALVVAGFTAIDWGTGIQPLSEAFVTSGSSLLTLGFVRPPGLGRVVLSFVEAGIGLGLVSLMISYLPSIYGSFSRREALVAMLEVRAGLPPSPVELLQRYRRIGWLDNIDTDLFEPWEPWFADIEESHTSLPALVFFRSPQPQRNWLTAAGCVLDTAAIVASCVDREPTGKPDLIVRSGFLALRRIADYFGLEYDPDPAPTDPISVSRAEFDEMWEQLAEVGVPLLDDREQAWRDFAGWRVNYDRPLVALCELVMAPPGRWSSDRPVPPRSTRPSRRARRQVPPPN